MAYRYEFTFDRHSELSNETIQNIRCYLNNLTDGRVVWNMFNIPHEMALYNLEQDVDEEISLEPNRSEPVRIRVDTPPLQEIHQSFEVSQPAYETAWHSESVLDF